MQKNQYYRGSHVSEPKFRQLVRYFVLDLSATDVAQLTGLTRKTVNLIFFRIRQRIAQVWEQEAQHQTTPAAVADLRAAHREYARYLEHDGDDAPAIETQPPDGGQRDDEPRNGEQHEYSDEKFQEFIKRRLQKFKGLSAHTLDLHLKECAWRFSRRDEDLYAELLKLLRKNPL